MAGERWRLDGRTVVVTAAARGIGAGSARRLAARGARVALLGLEPDELGRVASHCGPGAAAFPVDVTDVAALDVAVAAARERFGVLDALVANAGVAPVGMLRAADPVAFERTIEVNLLGVVRSMRAPQLLERRGYVLVIASIAAAVHAPGMAAYAAGKAGVEALADALRAELAHLGVDVGVAYPSWIGTDLIAATDADPTLSSMRAMLPGPFGRTYPVRMVGDAVVDALERRARRVYVPRWTALVVALRGLAALALERPLRGRAPEMDARFERDVAERGREDASAPLGGGGAAARPGGR